MTKGNQLSLTVSVSPLRLQFQRTIYRIFTLVSEGKSFSLPSKCFHFCLFASCDPEFGQIYPVSLKIPFSFRTLQFDGRHFENEPGCFPSSNQNTNIQIFSEIVKVTRLFNQNDNFIVNEVYIFELFQQFSRCCTNQINCK